ncbi:MAG TPA: carboxymuconolactone decarboxylase family protein [Acidimicrobiales bacterium]|jgi:AhpD family alkylhydroperoxidase|nr:carboxymuconolactone decarboxylase family protein [Acidimicrobiales bacterium]
MQARMTNPVFTLSGAMEALQAAGKASRKAGLSEDLLNMVNLRASQINGCGVCVDLHARDLVKAGISDERLWSIAAWREAPYYTDEERAALALTEAMTRIADQPTGVPDDVWDEATRHFDEQKLAGLVLAVANVNTWNRLNVTTRQIAGAWTG